AYPALPVLMLLDFRVSRQQTDPSRSRRRTIQSLTVRPFWAGRPNWLAHGYVTVSCSHKRILEPHISAVFTCEQPCANRVSPYWHEADRHKLTHMTAQETKSPIHYLVGPGASAGQIRLVIVPALLSALGCAVLGMEQGESDW